MPRIAVTKEKAPAKVVAAARRLGQNIKVARKRRRLRQKDLAARAGLTVQTLHRVEAGSLGTGLGAYLAVLWVMGLDGQFALLADPSSDLEGKTLEAAMRGERIRPGEAFHGDF